MTEEELLLDTKGIQVIVSVVQSQSLLAFPMQRSTRPLTRLLSVNAEVLASVASPLLAQESTRPPKRKSCNALGQHGYPAWGLAQVAKCIFVPTNFPLQVDTSFLSLNTWQHGSMVCFMTLMIAVVTELVASMATGNFHEPSHHPALELHHRLQSLTL